MLLRYLISGLAIAAIGGCDGGVQITGQMQNDPVPAQTDSVPAQTEPLIDAVNLRYFNSFTPVSGCEDDIGACAGAELFGAVFTIYPDSGEAPFGVASPGLVDDLGSARIVAAAADGSRAVYHLEVGGAAGVIDLDLMTNGAELFANVEPLIDAGNIRISPSMESPAPVVTIDSDDLHCQSLTDQRCAASVVLQHYSSAFDRDYRAIVIGRIGDAGVYRALVAPVLLDQYYRRLELSVDLSMLSDSDAANAKDTLDMRVVVSDQTVAEHGGWRRVDQIPGVAYASPSLQLTLDAR